jgi:hypothetical protein
VDKKEVATKQYGDFGLVSFEIPNGNVEVFAKLTRSWPRKLGDAISLTAVIAGLWFYYSNSKKWRKYINS